MEVEPPPFGRDINPCPFGGWQEYIFAAEAPYHNLVFPIAFEYCSFVIFQELPELGFVTESDAVTLIKVSRVRICLSVKSAWLLSLQEKKNGN